MKVKEIYSYIDKIAPFRSAMQGDNCGLLCGDMEAEVKKALVCLDITNAVVEEAHRLGCELIISHHPIIFEPIRSVRSGSIPYELAHYGITAICAHTNLDISPVGTNAQLAKLLDLAAIEMMEGEAIAIGILKHEMSVKSFAKQAKENLNAKGLRYLDCGKNIKRVGMCSGAGGDMLYKIANKIDCFVTGEIKHHQIIDAERMGVSVLDLGHYRTEFIVCAPLCSMLSRNFNDVEFIVSQDNVDLMDYA